MEEGYLNITYFDGKIKADGSETNILKTIDFQLTVFVLKKISETHQEDSIKLLPHLMN